MGLLPEDVAQPPSEVWPCNWDAVNLFLRIGTQWRVGMNGPTGLDYNTLYPLIPHQPNTEDFNDLLDQIRVLESVALEEMHKE